MRPEWKLRGDTQRGHRTGGEESLTRTSSVVVELSTHRTVYLPSGDGGGVENECCRLVSTSGTKCTRHGDNHMDDTRSVVSSVKRT